jgi:adenine-specific DNA methylase
MPDAAQFTLALFDSTGLGTSVQAPARVPAADAADSHEANADSLPREPGPAANGCNYVLDGDRALARGWVARARDNIVAIRLSKEIEAASRAPTHEEQAQLLRFVGFGATELAQNCFPLPGATGYRDGWEAIGGDLADAVTPAEYAALQRATQYAHYTPESVVRALWHAAQRLGFAGGRVLEPGMGTGLFFAVLPDALRGATHLTGIEYDPVTARIARLIHPEARVRCEDYTRSNLAGSFDLVIGNPPFADRIVRADPTTSALGLRLHDYFIARSIARLRPGGIALFVSSTGTMDKASTAAREHIAGLADLVGAVRLPEGVMHATAGTEVVIDVLVFQRRAEGQAPSGPAWTNLVEIAVDGGEADAGDEAESDASIPDAQSDAADSGDAEHLRRGVAQINEYFACYPEMVLGTHAQRRGIYGPGLSYTCRPRPSAPPIEASLRQALDRLPSAIVTPSAELTLTDDEDVPAVSAGTAADGATIKEGSFFVGKGGRLSQIVNGRPVAVAIRQGRGGEGITTRAAKVIRALLPIRDAIRDVLRAQAADRPWAEAQVRLRVAYSAFIRYFGPINHTVISTVTDPETGEERETHRRPNLAHFADDPDCWLVASIESYDVETGLARKGPIFSERVIAPPVAPLITSATDALAVTLNETGRVDLEYLADLLERDPNAALAELGTAVFRNPETTQWDTADAYLSGPVRTRLAVAEAASALDPQYERNIIALRAVQPKDISPSDITARLGAEGPSVRKRTLAYCTQCCGWA